MLSHVRSVPRRYWFSLTCFYRLFSLRSDLNQTKIKLPLGCIHTFVAESHRAIGHLPQITYGDKFESKEINWFLMILILLMSNTYLQHYINLQGSSNPICLFTFPDWHCIGCCPGSATITLTWPGLILNEICFVGYWIILSFLLIFQTSCSFLPADWLVILQTSPARTPPTLLLYSASDSLSTSVYLVFKMW